MKIFKTIVVFLLCFCLLTGCSSTDKQSAEEVAEKLKELSGDTVSWSELDSSKMSSYFQLEEGDVNEFKGYINNSEERFDMIAVFSFKKEENKKAVLGAVESTLRMMNENYRLANGDEAAKISGRLLAETDNLIILCITDQNDSIKTYLTEEIKAKLI